MNAKTVILWDIDGTLLLTGGAGAQAFNRVFEELYGEPFIWKNINPDGRTDDWIIDQLFLSHFKRTPSGKERAKVIALYNDSMREALRDSPNFRLMPSAMEVVSALHADPGVHMGLATGNYKLAAHHKLKRGGLDSFFSFGGYGCDSAERLQLTQVALERAIHYVGGQPDALLLIGDTIHDISCGKAIGAKTVAVCTGSTPRAVLEAAGADRVLDDLTGLIETLEDWKVYSR